jgi:ABC-type transporter Mla subunit MlaD
MSPFARYVKLGFFTTLIAVLAIGAAVWLGIIGRGPATTQYHCFVDNSVQGLDVGAAVKFRGVEIGSVESVKLAADARHIDVMLSIDVPHARALEPDAPDSPVRAKAVMLGITGVKIIDFDVVDPKTSPRPELPFPPPPNTIATAPTMLEGLERELDKLATQLPPLIDGLSKAVAGLSVVVDTVNDEGVVKKVTGAIQNVSSAAAELGKLSKALGESRLPEGIEEGINGLNDALGRVNVVLERIGGDGGLVMSAQRATDAFGDLGRSAAGSGARLDTTLRDVDEAARAIRDLAIELQQQPDILLKGRARGRPRR